MAWWWLLEGRTRKSTGPDVSGFRTDAGSRTSPVEKSRDCRSKKLSPLVHWEAALFGVVPAEDCRTVAPQGSQRPLASGSVLEIVLFKLQRSGSGLWNLELVSRGFPGKMGATHWLFALGARCFGESLKCLLRFLKMSGISTHTGCLPAQKETIQQRGNWQS